MDFHTITTCLLAVTLLTLTPGVDTLLVVRNSVRGGRREGVMSSLGICSGLFIHALVSACGISLLLMKTAWAFNVLKLLGAGYLIWLGISSLRNATVNRNTLTFIDPRNSKTKPDNLRAFREGFLSNVLNPKAVIFYMAFLPQFINPAKGAISQSLIVAAIHFTVAMIWQCSLASMVNKAKSLLQNPHFSRFFDTLTGSMMIYLGVRLLTDE